MVDHRTAQIGPGERAHEGPVVDHGKPANPAVDHHDRRPGEFVGRSDRRRVAHDEGVEDAVGEDAAAFQENPERIGERSAAMRFFSSLVSCAQAGLRFPFSSAAVIVPASFRASITWRWRKSSSAESNESRIMLSTCSSVKP